MNILYISNSILPSRNANSVHVMKMCQAFAKNGHTVTLLGINHKEYVVNNIFDYYGVDKCFEVKLCRLPDFKKKLLLYLFFVFKQLKRNEGSLVYGRFVSGCTFAAISGFPVYLESHGPLWNTGLITRISFNILRKSNKFKRLILISNALKNIYIKKAIIPKSIKFVVAHDGADELIDRKNFAKLNGRKNVLKIGYVGHLYKGRGIEIIIQCAERLPEFDFHIVGGNESDIKFWKEKIKGHNIFMYGFQAPNEVEAYRNSFDVYLAPYQKVVTIAGNGNTVDYMSPLKIFEYMSHRKPIICSDLPVLREILNEKNSILVPCDDVDSWINAIKEINNGNKNNLLADNSYDDFINNYTWQKRAELVLK